MFKVKAIITTRHRSIARTDVVEYEAKDQHWYVVMAYLMKGKITSYTGWCGSAELYLREMIWDLEGDDACSFAPNEQQSIVMETVAI